MFVDARQLELYETGDEVIVEVDNMRIEFKDFGQAQSGSISIADLTVICGPNSSGKTYASYAVYAALKHFSEFFDFDVDPEDISSLARGRPIIINLLDIRDNFGRYIAIAEGRFTSGLDRFFNAPDDFFSETSFNFHLSAEEIPPLAQMQVSYQINTEAKIEGEVDPRTGTLTLACSRDETLKKIPRRLLQKIINDVIFDAILGESVPSPFVVTSERTGVALFYKDLDYNSNAILSHLRDSDKIDPFKIIEAMRSRYARPIQDNIDTIRDYDNASKRKSFFREQKEEYKYVFDILTDLLGGGAFKSSDGQVTYATRKKRNRPKLIVPLYIASSSVKSLFLIDLYINHIAKRNQILIIDEPELNLHPDNQVKFARLIARLVNSGVKVLITTHSDYIVREINNLVSMSSVGEEKDSLLQRYNLTHHDVLKPSQVKAYCAGQAKGFLEMSVSNTGINTAIFDSIISLENNKAQDINFSVED